MEWYLKVLKQYADFEGRARRKEYWMFVLINFLISTVLSIVDRMMGLTMGIGMVYSLFVLIPGISVGVRRLHDIGKSGWWMLLLLIPILGWIWLIVLYATDSQPGDNDFGPNPKDGPEEYFD